MAVIRQGVLGGFRGRVGNIVGTGWKGIAVMKSLPLSVANPRTAGQVAQRNKFALLTCLASLLLAAVVKPLWDRFASNMSGYNAFISANQGSFNPMGNIDPAKLVVSKGRMLSPTIGSRTTSGNTMNCTITNPIGDKYALPTDKIYAVGLHQTNLTPLFQGDTGVTRGASATTIVPLTFPDTTALGNCGKVYISYLRADGSEVSNSGYRDYQ